MDRRSFFECLWDDFVGIAPVAGKLRERFEAAGEVVKNDHVAFRTFDRGALALHALEPLILGLGYEFFEEYEFEQKKLRAKAYRLEGWPRIFISELLVDELPEAARVIVERCAQAAPPEAAKDERVFFSGRLWPALRYDEYQRLADVSEYAAWLCALGMHANHFTVSVGDLKQLSSLEQVVDFVLAAGMAINTSGGAIKGTRADLLEQASTLADRLPVEFADGSFEIPTCYYEFARRYPDASGKLFDGFVTQSADKIFESTDRR